MGENITTQHTVSENSGLQSFYNKLKDNYNVVSLNIQDSEMNEDRWQIILDGIKNNNCIKNLACKFLNGLSVSGCEKLATALMSNNSINHLNLNGNKIGYCGLETLVQVFSSSNCSISTLELNENEITDSGFRYLCDALKRNTTLKSLEIASNEIGDEGCECLREMLKLNSTLKYIDFNHNQFQQKGAEHLCHVLKENNTLIEFKFGHNDEFYSMDQDFLIKCIRENNTIVDIDVEDPDTILDSWAQFEFN